MARRRTLALAWARSSPSLAAALVCLAAPRGRASAQTYTDVPAGYWARGAIDWVTDVGPRRAARCSTTTAARSSPSARSPAAARSRSGDRQRPPGRLVDADRHPRRRPRHRPRLLGHPDRRLARISWPAAGDGFHPDATVPAYKAEAAVVRMIKLLHPDDDWTHAHRAAPGRWEPNAGLEAEGPARDCPTSSPRATSCCATTTRTATRSRRSRRARRSTAPRSPTCCAKRSR